MVPNGYNGLSDAGQQSSDFVDVFSFVVVLDAVVEDSAHECSLIGFIGKNKMVNEDLEEQGSSLLKGFKGCKLTLDYLKESGLNIVTDVAVGPFQLIVEGSLCGGGDALCSGSNGISDIQSIVLESGSLQDVDLWWLVMKDRRDISACCSRGPFCIESEG